MSDAQRRTATLLKPNLRGFTGDARLYELDPPLNDYNGRPHTHVVVSATYAMFSGPETYIFPADPDGHISDWGELPGSLKGTVSHEEALSEAGYEVER